MEAIKLSFSNAAIGTKPEVLHDIHSHQINIAVYERDISHLQKDINSCLLQSIELKCSGTVEEVRKNIESYFQKLSIHAPELKADIVDLINLFGDISKTKSFKILLASVNTNMCRRFHTDRNDLRLLCTYSGPGTLWVPDEFVNRDALESFRDNDCILTDASQVQQAPTGSVVILKGAVYPKKGTLACVHRSPSIEESGETRFLLRVDTN
jgi:hypothetical protein